MNILSINDNAPNFILPCESGESLSLTKFRNQNIVLYFYPKDDTPGCTQESKDFRDKHDEFLKLNTVILGISKDTIDKHEDFIKKYTLPFSLISDEDLIAIKEYVVWAEKSMYGKKYMGIERSTFLINKEGKIHKMWRKVSVGGHVDEVLAAVKELEA